MVLSRGREEHWVTVCRETLRCLWVAGLAQTLARARSCGFTILGVQCWPLQRNLRAQGRAAVPTQGGHRWAVHKHTCNLSGCPGCHADQSFCSPKQPYPTWIVQEGGGPGLAASAFWRSQQIPCFSDYLSQNFHLLGKNHPDPTRWSRHPLISGISGQGTRNCTSSGHPPGPPGTCRHLLVPVTSVHGYQLKTVLSGCRKTNTQITQTPTPHPTDTPAIS